MRRAFPNFYLRQIKAQIRRNGVKIIIARLMAKRGRAAEKAAKAGQKQEYCRQWAERHDVMARKLEKGEVADL